MKPVEPALRLVVVQPTPFCNIDCRYCYLPDRGVRRRMKPETLRHLFERVFESGWAEKELEVLWHSGEPTVLGVAWYESALATIESLRPAGISITHAIQTNATLLTQDWCDFIKRAGIRIGVSVDGPKDLHDANRVTRAGRGTFDRTLAGMRMLRANGIDFGAIVVLSSGSLDRPEELFHFLVDEGVERVCLNIEEVAGVHQQTSLAGDDVYERVRVFTARFWALALETEKLRVPRDMGFAFASVLRPNEAVDTRLFHAVEPFTTLNVDVDGNFSTFSPELLAQKSEAHGDFRFGNVARDALESTFRKPAFRRLHDEIRAGVDACANECEFYSVCGGGSPAHKLAENGSAATTETLFCRLTTQLPVELAREFYELAD